MAMKLSEFEAHPAWTTLRQLADVITAMRAEDTGTNIDVLQNIEAQTAYLLGLYKSRRRLAPLVFSPQLDGLQSQLGSVMNSIGNARGNADPARTQYLQQTQQYMQNAFAIVGLWVTLTPTKVEERAEIAVIEELQRRNAALDEHYRRRIDDINTNIATLAENVAEANTRSEETEARIVAVAGEAKRAVDIEKERIGKVIDDGQKTIAGFEGDLQSALEKWQRDLEKQFTSGLKGLREQQQTLLVNAKKRYDELKSTVADYQAIVQADSADRLALHYENEAKSARKSGWLTITVGFVLLLTAAVPLLVIVLQPALNAGLGWNLDEADWPSLAARIAFALVLVGAATVAIRMGNRFHHRADEYKRLAMELRTMGPFLSTVVDTESVDQARLDLVNRTFGQSYAPSSDNKDVDAVPVTVLQQLFTMLTKVVSR